MFVAFCCGLGALQGLHAMAGGIRYLALCCMDRNGLGRSNGHIERRCVGELNLRSTLITCCISLQSSITWVSKGLGIFHSGLRYINRPNPS